jgi:hypothetical protein
MKSIILSLVATVAFANPFANKGTATAPNMAYKPQYLQAMTPSSYLGDAELGRYVDELNECYDVNNDGLFNRTEMIDMLKGTLYGKPCPAKRHDNNTVDISTILNTTNINQLQNFFGGRRFQLTRLYASNGNQCNSATWHAAVDTKA